MKETSKCFNIRKSRGDFEQYLKGHGLDVGAGDDILQVLCGDVVPYDYHKYNSHTNRWDAVDGRSGHLLADIDDAAFDFVYSSHCLEHLPSVEDALTNWVRVLKPLGFLYFVVPDYLLYEKLTWPSRYGAGHWYSFSIDITREQVKRNNHYNIGLNLEPVLRELGVEVVRVTLEADGFDYNQGVKDQTRGRALSQICVVGQKKGS